MLLTLSVLLVVAVTALVAYRLFVLPRMTVLNALPSPSSHWLLGNMREITREPTVAPHWRWYEELGRPPVIHYHMLFGRSSVLVLDADLVREVLVSKRAVYGKNYWQLKKVIGDGLVTLDGDEWRLHRQIIQPAFSSGTVKALVNSIVPLCTRDLLTLWTKLSESGETFKVHEHLSALTLDVIGRAAFDHRFNALQELCEPGQVHEDAVKKLFFENLRAQVTLLSVLLGSYFRYLRFLPGLRERHQATQQLDRAVDAIVAAKRSSMQRDATTSAANGGGDDSDEELDGTADDIVRRRNFLSLLFGAVDETGAGLADKALRDEVKTFLMAGHETTTTLCTWVFFALSQHPEVEERLVAEIRRVCGEDRDRDITCREASQMQYLDAVVKEVLRMYPPVPMVVRFTTEDDRLGEQHDIPCGTRVCVPMIMLHRMEQYWGDTATTFDPERWRRDTLPYSNSCAYMPFLVGARNCIGKHFAQLEAKIIIASLLRCFRLELSPKQKEVDFALTTFITMMPKPFPEFVAHERTDW
eukprot:TRINITY_DN9436_c0_g1_i1.p1 TRINITY_DN9436_c0_g1~~TRINITY_DN9436_c0_g1_i1.p1  ORF type:complete len:541 (+),score=171.11 TRINITY_DN9436_c0_g1_i1:42-1625(+)